LLQKDDLRDRFVLLLGEGRVHVTTQALDEAGKKVSRYLLMQLVVNATYGIPVGICLFRCKGNIFSRAHGLHF